jgi:hypothetical protein
MATSHVKDSPLSVEVNKKAHEFDKNQFDSLMVSRFFYAPAFEIYGGEWLASILFYRMHAVGGSLVA